MPFNSIIDCFLYDGEFDLLCLRLKLHSAYVDRFVIVQSSVTFQGNHSTVPKLDVESLEKLIPSCNSKIFFIYLDESDFDLYSTAPEREISSRQSFSRGLVDLNPDDLVLISDVDELFDFTSFISQLSSNDCIYQLNLFFAYFCPNYICINMPWWGAPIAIPGSLFSIHQLSIGSLRPVGDFNSTLPADITIRRLFNCGVHMSFLGGYHEVLRKLSRYSDSPDLAFQGLEGFNHMIATGRDVFGRNLYWGATSDMRHLYSSHFYSLLQTLPHSISSKYLPKFPFFKTYLRLLKRCSTPHLYFLIRLSYFSFFMLYQKSRFLLNDILLTLRGCL